ncbi:hypothetical protein I2486_17100 [Cellulophaga sp. E16_2]|uniref:hypothetical protein n=1 Tax=Cellulophaga sp. E16_2 TaxID=2789297 RepID=UPI001A9301DE|nr:hypothetical protein [Cellulophaga sp. E16_2]MBO0593122.1 hypothetical protein [Cellulophaga sp. E16_2]
MDIDKSLDFFTLKNKHIFNIAEIEWWLLKYKETHEKCKRDYKNLCSCFGDLPCCCVFNSLESKFIDFYDELNKITEVHRFEDYAKRELITYKNISCNKPEVKKWLAKNENMASKVLACFLFDYLDYSEDENDILHLLAYRNRKKKLEIFIERADFIHLIEYKELFDDLYYVKELYPEGLKRIQDEIDKLPTE